MKAQRIVGRSGRFARIGGRYHVAAGGAVVILALASGFAVGFGVVVDRLTTTSAPRVLAAEASEARPFRSIAHVVDRWYDEPAAAMTRASGVADRRQDGATGGSAHDQYQRPRSGNPIIRPA
jgi:hypothetical protein